MPANGLDGGGAMTVQELDQVIDFISSIQLPQNEVVAKTGGAVDLALSRIANGDETAQGFIALQEAKIDAVAAAPAQLEATGALADEVLDLLGAAGTCTEESAILALTTCDDAADDADRDGLSDVVEPELTAIAVTARANLTGLNETTLEFDEKAVYAVEFDPLSAHSNRTADGAAVPDLDAAAAMLGELEADIVVTRVTAEQQDQFLGDLEAGLAFLEQSADSRIWDVDLDSVTEAMNEAGDRSIGNDQAERAVGLFNSYCARCHTGGYSSGSPFEIEAGHGGWGPAIYDGRTLIQFPTIESQIDFVIKGTQLGTEYGVNGIGNGEMPGFGASLTAEDIELIVLYERTL
jgi:mono/diheme cytochrome c family protein